MGATTQLFKDPDRQREFDEWGWTKLQLLDQGAVDRLREYYAGLSKSEQGREGFHISLETVQREEVVRTRDFIRGVFFEQAGHHFDDIQAFTASFVVKEPNPRGVVPPHQDWSFTDEEHFCSATVWIPLLDVDMRNGALGVINGSHRFFDMPRPSPSPEARSVIADHLVALFPWLKIVPLKAGEALVFHNSTIHGSPPNCSEAPRIAAGIGIAPSSAPLWHYYQIPETSPIEVACYEVDELFFTAHHNALLSERYRAGRTIEGYPVRARAERTVLKQTSEDVLQLVHGAPGNEYNAELVEQMTQIFGSYAQQAQPETAASPAPPERQKVYTFKNIMAEIRFRLRVLLRGLPSS